jgi:hypothetical protein
MITARVFRAWTPELGAGGMPYSDNYNVACAGEIIVERSRDLETDLAHGTLSDNPETLGRLTGVHAPRWPGVWGAIKTAFISIDGGKLTNDGLRAELAKAKAITAVRQATGRLGGETTQLRLRHSQPMSRIHRSPMTAPNPLGTNDVAQANAKHNTTQQIKTKGERSGEPRPETGSPSLEKKKAFSEEPVVVPLPIPQSPALPEGASDSPLERALNNWGENFKRRQRGTS